MQDGKTSIKWFAAAAVLLAVSTGVLLHPVLFNIGSRAVANLDDPQFNAFTLWWGCNRLLRLDFAGWWDAPIFKPYHNSLAYSEHQFVNVVTAIPFHLFSNNPILVHNIVLMLTFVLSGVSMFALARRFTGSEPAALVGAFVFAFNAYRMHHLIHVQVLAMQFIPLSMLAVSLYAESPTWRRLWLATAACLGLLLSCNYYAAMGPAILLPFALFELRAYGRLGDPSSWKKIAAGTAVFAVLAAPFVWPYAKFFREMALSRSEAQTMQFSARASNWIAPAEGNTLWGKKLDKNGRHEGRLFPGAAALSLAAAGIASLLSSRASSGRRRFARPEAIFVFIAAATFILSFGLKFELSGKEWPGPYRLLHDFVPGYSGMRVPARFAAFGIGAVAVLAAFGFSLLSRRLPRAAAAVVAIILSGGVTAEAHGRLWHEEVRKPSADPIYRKLRDLPGRGNVLEVPLLAQGADARQTYATTYHRKTTVNGYSGHFTPLMVEIKDVMQDFPSDRALSAVRGAGVRYLVVREGDPAMLKTADTIADAGGPFSIRYLKGNDRIYEFADYSRAVLDPGRLSRPVAISLPAHVCTASVLHGSIEFENETGTTLAADRRVFRKSVDWVPLNAAGTAEAGAAVKTALKIFPRPLSEPGTPRAWLETVSPATPGSYLARLGDAKTRVEVGPAWCGGGNDQKFKSRDLNADAPPTAAAGALVPVTIKVKNDSKAVWPALGRSGDHEEFGVVRVGVWLFDGPYERFHARLSLPNDVPPGEGVVVSGRFPARVKPGIYNLKVDLISEREAWFSERGIRPYNRPITIVE